MATARVFAPAKINLTLHVTGQRDDGYHLLDSLVAFASVGDWVTAQSADALSFAVEGPMAQGVPTDGSNLVLQAALLMETDFGAALTLEKHLPAASGIGGGSSDAAATMRALSQLWACPLPKPEVALTLGADIPVCMMPQTLRMRGIGDHLVPVDGMPPLWALLVNPRVEVPTPAVFANLTGKSNPPMPQNWPPCHTITDLCEWLSQQRNDLQTPAIQAAPVIAAVLDVLRDQSGCLLARMSGSGATCFGLFTNAEDAERAARSIGSANPDWWVAPCTLG